MTSVGPIETTQQLSAPPVDHPNEKPRIGNRCGAFSCLHRNRLRRFADGLQVEVEDRFLFLALVQIALAQRHEPMTNEASGRGQ